MSNELLEVSALIEETLWKGEIKIVKINDEDGEILRIDDEGIFDFDGLKVAIRKIKHEGGRNMAIGLLYGLLASLERAKLELWLNMGEILGD